MAATDTPKIAWFAQYSVQPTFSDIVLTVGVTTR